jgi:hypothetical protein
MLALFLCVCLTIIGGCPEPEPPAPPPQPVGPPEPVGPQVQMPRTYVTVPDALIVAHMQFGLKYAAPHDALHGVVGPFPVGKTVGLDKLIAAIDRAAGLSHFELNGVTVF